VAAVAFPDGPLFWRPTKEDRGVYEVFLRYRVGAVGRDLPYAGRPPEPTLFVLGPDLRDLPVSVTLRGRAGGTAVGVLRYANAPRAGVAPDGTPVELTSPLQVWTPAGASPLAWPRRLEVPAGRSGYHRLSAACPKKPGVYELELPVYTNDPDYPEVVLPVVLLCEDRDVPEPVLDADRTAGAAPLRANLRLGLARADDALACALDFGDGSPPRTWPAGACPRDAVVPHTYARPGTYQAVLLVSEAGEPVNLAFVTVQVD
jgi:hypothetical protein